MRNETILLVDDNPDDVELTILGFRKSHIANQIDVARDGREALAYLFGTDTEPAHELPIITILDLNMPRVSGLEVLKAVRSNERTAHMPVIVLTTSDEESDILNSYRLGTNAYVRKPVGFEKFIEAAKALGLFWLLLNVPSPGPRT